MKNRTKIKASEKNAVFITVFHQVKAYLSEKYDIRYNAVSKVYEIKKIKGENWVLLNENSLYVELNENGIKCSMGNLIAIIKSEYTPEYNPIENYFFNLKPLRKNENSYISKLAKYIDVDEKKEFKVAFKKWLVRVVKCALEPEFFNKQAFIFVQERQNSGKSTLCRWLCPPALKEYFAEDISNDKDSRILIANTFIINLDELSSLYKKEINSLKSLFSKEKVVARLPYDKNISVLTRTASFIGSTNLAEFLTDETGSVRWICFNLKAINWEYKKEIDINDIWREAYMLYKDSSFDYKFTRLDIELNEARNQKFQLRSVEYEAIQKYFINPSKLDKESTEYKIAKFYTATDVTQLISTYTTLRVSKINIGKALTALKFPKSRKGDRYGYTMIFKKPTYV